MKKFESLRTKQLRGQNHNELYFSRLRENDKVIGWGPKEVGVKKTGKSPKSLDS